MGGNEIGVAASIADVISAFEGSAIVLHRMKQQRATQRAPYLLNMLEESITQAPEEIDRERFRGIARFGSRFEEGDLAATVSLQQVTIELQTSLLRGMQDAGNEADIRTLAQTADLCRDKTIAALIALRQRLSHTEDAQHTTDTAVPSTFRLRTPIIAVTPSSSPLVDALALSAPLPSLERSVSDRSGAKQSLSSPSSEGPPPIPPRSTDRGRALPPLATSSAQVQISEHDQSDEDRPEKDSKTSPHIERFSTETRVDSAQSLYSCSIGGKDFGNYNHTNRSPTSNSSAGQKASEQSSQKSGLSTNARPQSSSPTTYPSSANDYLGFCKAAWKLQCGDDKAMTKSKDFSQSAQSKYHFLSCSKFRCDFKGRGPDVLTDSVITDEIHGIKYRWSFLAKSHVFVKSAPEGQYLYRCMFCAFGNGLPVVMNKAALLEHISHEHRGGRLSDIILDRTRCIDMRDAHNSEKFDINLLPLESTEIDGRVFDIDDPLSGYA